MAAIFQIIKVVCIIYMAVGVTFVGPDSKRTFCYHGFTINRQMFIIKHMFKYCPFCASEKIRFEQSKVFRCPDCGFNYYHNTAAATACIVNTDAGILFLVRNKDPGKGMLDLPGGFVDPGEGAVDGLLREFTEELGLDLTSIPGRPTQNSMPVFFASFPNIYKYKNISYNTCDLFFYLDVPGLNEKVLHAEKEEISAIRFIKARDLDMEDIAFESIKKAVRLYIDMNVNN